MVRLRYYEAQLLYIHTELPKQIDSAKQSRRATALAIYKCISRVRNMPSCLRPCSSLSRIASSSKKASGSPSSACARHSLSVTHKFAELRAANFALVPVLDAISLLIVVMLLVALVHWSSRSYGLALIAPVDKSRPANTTHRNAYT
jgi:hypothetical protein